jgi:hypothetical protein
VERLLDEGEDDFEEFNEAAFSQEGPQMESKLWREDWEDERESDSFEEELRMQLARH